MNNTDKPTYDYHQALQFTSALSLLHKETKAAIYGLAKKNIQITQTM